MAQITFTNTATVKSTIRINLKKWFKDVIKAYPHLKICIKITTNSSYRLSLAVIVQKKYRDISGIHNLNLWSYIHEDYSTLESITIDTDNKTVLLNNYVAMKYFEENQPNTN